MCHPAEDALIETLVGRGAPGDRRHLARCQQTLEPWRELVDDVCLMRDSALAPEELEKLGALFRVHGPVRSGLGEWVARLVRSTAATPVAVRGGGQVLVEHEAGPYHLVMQLRPAARARMVTIHGQVYGPGTGDGELVVSDEHGVTAAAPIDDLGEFQLRLPGGRCYTAALLLPDGRVVIDPLDLGGEGSG